MVVGESGATHTLRAELDSRSVRTMQVDGAPVASWPFQRQISERGRPLILQHALQNLLMCSPTERFSHFAALLGLDDLDIINRDIVSLCVKPDASAPQEVSDFLENTRRILTEASADPGFSTQFSLIVKGEGNPSEARRQLLAGAHAELPSETPDAEVLAGLKSKRAEAVARVFDGRVALRTPNQSETAAETEEARKIRDTLRRLVSSLTEIAAAGGRSADAESLAFLEIGLRLLEAELGVCPFCRQPVDQTVYASIQARLDALKRTDATASRAREAAATARRLTRDIRGLLDAHGARMSARGAELLATAKCDSELAYILGSAPNTLETIRKGRTAVDSVVKELAKSRDKVLGLLDTVDSLVQRGDQTSELAEQLVEAVQSYFRMTEKCRENHALYSVPLATAQDTVSTNAASAAGVRSLDLLIQLLVQWTNVVRYWKLRRMLDGLVSLRKVVEQYVTQAVMDQISSTLGEQVQHWYDMIRTAGDPDVHFSGFDVATTRQGTTRGRHIQIKASSYGKPLLSAVSSLSESKLNALGLAIGIASSMAATTPFEFLVIDDPIQSWDSEHEERFIEVLRVLVEEHHRQVVVLSHNKGWIDRLRRGCQTLNGSFIEITGFTKNGPSFKDVEWCPVKERLDAIQAIVQDQTSDMLRLQQAEEEIRFVIAETTAHLYSEKTGTERSAHTLGSGAIRKLLLQCGVDLKLVDHIVGTFETTDPAHHVVGAGGRAQARDRDYAPDRGRIKSYLEYVYQLRSLLKSSAVSAP
ncbi:MAG: hypothetical protein M0R22_02185 [Dehalococcoidia bacterium]|nr:hypothetical protein [Dehalococcoidia bacterium]